MHRLQHWFVRPKKARHNQPLHLSDARCHLQRLVEERQRHRDVSLGLHSCGEAQLVVLHLFLRQLFLLPAFLVTILVTHLGLYHLCLRRVRDLQRRREQRALARATRRRALRERQRNLLWPHDLDGRITRVLNELTVVAQSALQVQAQTVLHHEVDNAQELEQLGELVHLAVGLLQVEPALANVLQGRHNVVLDVNSPVLAHHLAETVDGGGLGVLILVETTCLVQRGQHAAAGALVGQCQ
mmetsp:Transcript_53891/g.129874  ORF Transcript_53891/g.129874 Transcript_53891/m.129874 type:complete len:241 (+) Transcript_53891:315-1037(+)